MQIALDASAEHLVQSAARPSRKFGIIGKALQAGDLIGTGLFLAKIWVEENCEITPIFDMSKTTRVRTH